MTPDCRLAAASRLVSVRDAMTRLDLGRTRISSILDHGDLVSIKIGSRRLILVSSLDAFIASQRAQAARDGRVRVPPTEAERHLP
jgi:hypothetical protein